MRLLVQLVGTFAPMCKEINMCNIHDIKRPLWITASQL